MFSSRQTFWIQPAPAPSGDPNWANVILLLNTNNSGQINDRTFKDISSNNYSITVGTYATYAGKNPANANGSYGSYYNAGTFSGGLRVGSGGPTYAGDFTVECWAMAPTDSPLFTYPSPIISANNSGFFSHQPVAGRANIWRADSYGGPTFNFTSNTTSNDGVWRHMALVRSGNASNNLKYYFDGNLAGQSSATSTGTLSFSAFNLGCGIGTGPGAGDNQFYGYVAGARLSNVARYTANFTPQRTPLTSDANTQFLMNGDEGAFYDVSIKGHGIRQVGTIAEQSNTYQKFTGANTIKSLGAANVSNVLIWPARNNTSSNTDTTATGNFTIEAFIYMDNSTSNTNAILFDGGSGATSLQIRTVNPSTGNYNFGIVSNSGAVYTTANNRDNSWHHLAAVRDGSNIVFYVDGNSVGNVVNSGNVPLRGNILSGPNAYLGQMRITNGIARYTANFTPPTTAFPDN